MGEISARSRAIADEQNFVETAYAALDRQRDAYSERLREVRVQQGHESAGALSERDSFATHYEDNLIRLRNVENRLVMGRLDFKDGETEHIGRIGLKDEDQEILLLDWRTPQAEPFYRATAAEPRDVVRRRHIQTRMRDVIGVEDELLDADASEGLNDLNLTGEGALMAAMSSARDGKMSDIVATIQAEQDRIIRADSSGILVVQGGPGTGKTAVALHRAAYLLYTQRERLSRSGVLIVGPSPVFLRYIDQVLPSLGESDIVSTTITGLLPGIEATGVDAPESARVKGKIVWKAIAANAVRNILQRPLDKAVSFTIDSSPVTLLPKHVEAAQQRARRGGRPHNEARDTYAKVLVEELANQVAKHKEIALEDADWIVDEVVSSIDARREINLRWLPSSPVQLLERLYCRPELLAECAPEFTTGEIEAVRRPKGSPITAADIPILDELSEHLGTFRTDFEKRQRAAAQARDAELSQYVKETMSSMNLGGGIVNLEQLTERVANSGAQSTLADRASSDRTWTYGHVVVDEAQELSPMQWEMLARRCPTRSMTVVGDLDQRPDGSPLGGWKAILGRLGSSARVENLTVSYRTPATILHSAERTLAAAGVDVLPIEAARDLPDCLTFTAATDPIGHVAASVRKGCVWMDGEYGPGEGTLAVIAASDSREKIVSALEYDAETERYVRADAAGLTRVSVLSAVEAKGLEYDVVVLVEPSSVLAEGPGNLYVAMTRPTRRLDILHSGSLPAGMA